MVLEEPQSPSKETALSKEPRRLRVCELILVVSAGYMIAAVSSLEDWWTAQGFPEIATDELYWILRDSFAISVLVYVLYRQGRSLKTIGFTTRVSDIFWGLSVWLFSYVMSEAVFSVLDAYSVSYPEGPVPRHMGWLTWLAVVPSAAAEELIVRAYLMTEVAELTGRMWIAVLASVGFQTLYHLYQGTPHALVNAGSFFVAALFYASTRRATPVILAHAWHNFWVLS